MLPAGRRGLVVRLEANRPTVELSDGTRWLCHLRGKGRKQHGRILVGDQVLVCETDPGQARLDAVFARGVTLVRPPVANVGGVIAVLSMTNPRGSLELLDRRLVIAEALDLRIIIAVSKADLLEEEDYRALAAWAALYPVVWTSATTGQGIEELLRHMEELGSREPPIWVLTGESGAGKSSLVNLLAPEAREGVQGLSQIDRGRQTTRMVSLYKAGGAWIADTPGFQRLDMPILGKTELLRTFPEWQDLSCRFQDCTHREEPGCGVKTALDRGDISALRYQHYRLFFSECVREHPH